MKIDRGSIVAGLPLGPLLVVVGYTVLRKSHVTINDLLLWVLVAFPTAVMLVAAVVAAALRLDAIRWFSMAIGAAVGTVFVAALVVGGISAIAWMISDPG
jgi:hypothetical protein